MYNSNMQPQKKHVRWLVDMEAPYFYANKQGHSILATLFSLDYDYEITYELFRMLIVDYEYNAWQSTTFTD